MLAHVHTMLRDLDMLSNVLLESLSKTQAHIATKGRRRQRRMGKQQREGIWRRERSPLGRRRKGRVAIMGTGLKNGRDFHFSTYAPTRDA